MSCPQEKFIIGLLQDYTDVNIQVIERFIH